MEAEAQSGGQCGIQALQGGPGLAGSSQQACRARAALRPPARPLDLPAGAVHPPTHLLAPVQPPLVSRPDADGTGKTSGKSLGPRRLVLNAAGLLAAMTRIVHVDDRPLELVDEADAPDVVLFDPEEHPELPQASRPYVKVGRAGAVRACSRCKPDCPRQQHRRGKPNSWATLQAALLQVLVDKFLAAKLRPHQVAGVGKRAGQTAAPSQRSACSWARVSIIMRSGTAH